MQQDIPSYRTARSTLDPNANEMIDLDDDGLPKRPPNAYMLFCNDTREGLLQREPTLNYKTVMTRLGELWNGLSVEERQPYVERARQSQSEFKRNYPNYKYKPRKPKPTYQQANQLVLPAGISNAEASYLMLLGAQTLLNQKGVQGSHPINPALQMSIEDKNKGKKPGKMDDQPFGLNDGLPIQLSSLQPMAPEKMVPVNAFNAALQIQQSQMPGFSNQGLVPHMPPPPPPQQQQQQQQQQPHPNYQYDMSMMSRYKQ